MGSPVKNLIDQNYLRKVNLANPIVLGHPHESFDTYPHTDILNDIGGPRKPWHQDYGRPNEEKIVIPKLPDSPYGFKYILEAPTSSSVRREDDR